MHPGWLVAWTVGTALGGDFAAAVPVPDPIGRAVAAAGPASPPPVRGLGTVTGRIPGTTEVTGGVRIARHHARIVVHDGFARTEIEEEVANDTARVLEGRYAFAVPAGAAVTRLALWVGHDLVEGELVERRRARAIFRGIVEDTVRPRDPALLEHVRGGELSMTIFPLPARDTRTVVLAWDEALEPVGGRLRLVHALAPGAGRAAHVDDLAITVEVVGAGVEVEAPGWAADVARGDDVTTLTIEARDRVPERDLVLDLGPASPGPVLARSAPERPTGRPDAPAATYFAARFTVPAPEEVAPVRPIGDRVVVLDTSASQTPETIAAQAALARAAARALRPEERLAVLACDAACEAFPAAGVIEPDAGALGALDVFLDGLAPRGASDLAGAIVSGAARLERGGQVVVAHDGHASAGELAVDAIAARVAGPVEVAGADVRLVGIGRTVDELALALLAAEVGATFEPWGAGPVGERALALASGLDRAALDDAAIELPPGVEDVVPSSLPRVRVGDPVTVMGTLAPGIDRATLRLVGALQGEPVAVAIPLAADGGRPNPLLPKLWAHRTITALEAEGEPARGDVVALSRAHHVLSRHTSLLVLENERMFADFGVERTTLRPEDQSDHGFGARGGASAAEGGPPLADPGAGAPAGSHRTRPPQVRMGHSMVSGRLPPESVQRIVRLQMGRFRACYERGLARNPDLAGRVATRFAIGWTGQVVSTADAGSDLPDREVVACVVRHFQALQFPPPEGGTVTVVYPIVFSSDGTRPKAPPALWPEPTVRPLPPRPRVAWTPPPPRPSPWVVHVTHLPGDDRWRSGRDAELARLAAAVAAEPASRSHRDRHVRALLLAGRWPAARAAAAELLELDPDRPLAHELAAMAAAAEDDRGRAVFAVAGVAESAPRDVDAHRRAARAFAAAGDGRRACAHLRALAGLGAGRVVTLDHERAERCWSELLAGATVTIDAERDGEAAGGAFTATVRCAERVSRCPAIAIVTPTGRVVARAAPFGAEPIAGGLALAAAGEGTWRTVLLGGDPDARGTVRVRVHGSVREVPFTGTARTVLTTRVEQRWRPTAVW